MIRDKISVIVPNYNYANYLPDLFHCLKHQSYTNWECIIVDDGSNDNSISLIETIIQEDERFVLIQQTNSGPAAARSKGIDHASGEFIQLIDADDYIDLNKFERAITIFKNQENTDIIYSDYRFVDQSMTREWKEDFRKNNLSTNAFNDFLSRWELDLMIPIHSFIFRKSCFDRWGGMDPKFKTHEDWDIHLNFSFNDAKYHYDNTVGAYYRIHGSSSSRTDLTQNRHDIAKVLAKYLPTLRNDLELKLWKERYFKAIAQFIVEATIRKQINWKTVMNHDVPNNLKRSALLHSPLYLTSKLLHKFTR